MGLLDTTADVLDRAAATAQRDWRAPAVSAGVVRDGEVVWSGHVGEVSADGRPATDRTQFLIGSVTKTFTALLVLMLRDEGRLALDDPLDRHLGVAAHTDVTVRQMLAHASGLQREPAGRLWESLAAPDAVELMAQLGSAERVLPPLYQFHYSNLAYALLGQVVEELTGQPWEVALRERILDPLGMTDTGLTPQEDRARGYYVHPFTGVLVEEPVFDLKATGALGGLWSTVSDLLRYAAFVADPDPSVIRPETVDEMCRPLVMTDLAGWARGYGLGFELVRTGERVVAGHGGAMPGFLTGWRVRREDQVGAVVFANSTAGADSPGLATRLVNLVLDAEPSAVEPWRPSAPQPRLAGLLGSWWSEGEELRFEVRDNELWCRLPATPLTSAETRFAEEGPDRFRAVAGRERGELLEVRRGADGQVQRMYFATYALTREPLAFADLGSSDVSAR